MWPRVVEFMLGLWLLISPFIFRHPDEDPMWWINDWICGLVIVILALLSFWQMPFWRPVRHAHYALLLVALWLMGFAFFTASFPAAPALQNNMAIGLLLLMLPLVPNKAELPPTSWRKYLAKEMEHRSV